MIIDGFETTHNGSHKRVSAHIVWEDCAREDLRVYFEVDVPFSSDLVCNPDAFLTAAVIAAMHNGEKRVRMEAGARPEVRPDWKQPFGGCETGTIRPTGFT